MCFELNVLLGHDFCARPVHPQLQAYAQVVLHATDLAREGDLVLPERVGRLLELVAVDLELLAQPAGPALYQGPRGARYGR